MVKLRKKDKFIWRKNQKYELLMIPKRMVIVNQNIIGEQCIRNDDGMLVASDENKKNFEKFIMRSF